MMPSSEPSKCVEPTGPEICIESDSPDNTECHDFLSEDGEVVGSFCITVQYSNGEPSLVATFNTVGNWTHISNEFWMGENISNVPVHQNGGVDTDVFPYFWCNYEGRQSWTTELAIKYQCLNGVVSAYTLNAVAQTTVAKIYPNGTVIAGTRENAQATEYGSFNSSSFAFLNFTIDCECIDHESDSSCAPSVAPSNSGIPSSSPSGFPSTSPSMSISPTTSAAPTQLPTMTPMPSVSMSPTKNECPEFEDCRDAWAVGDENTCFFDLELRRPQWGWTNGPYDAHHSYFTLDLYAGSNDCNPENGARVGNVTVFLHMMEASVEYKLEPGYYMEETSLYVGHKNTHFRKIGSGSYPEVNPDYFPIQNTYVNATEDMLFISNLCQEAYITAHALVCGRSCYNEERELDVVNADGLDKSHSDIEGTESHDLIHQPPYLESNVVFGVIPGLADKATPKKDIRSDSLDVSSTESTELGCQSAFAYHSRSHAECFHDIGFDQWGWTNGVFNSSGDAYILDIYAGAAACDIDRATYVGTLTVEYDGSEAVITYDIGSEFWLKETHSYVGTDRLPFDGTNETVDPRKYPIVQDENAVEGLVSDTFIISGFENNPVYVISHATICGYYPKNKHFLDQGTEKPVRSSSTSRLRGHAKQYLYQKSWFSSVATAAIRAARKLW